MNRKRFSPILSRCLGLGLVTLPGAVQACATCYGESDSPMAQGMNWGIMTLLVVIGCVLAGIVSFFAYLGWRASRLPSVAIPSPTPEN